MAETGQDAATLKWQPVATAPENVVVWTKIDGDAGPRNEQLLKRHGRLWFFPDGSMYVYYTPTHWAAIARASGAAGEGK